MQVLSVSIRQMRECSVSRARASRLPYRRPLGARAWRARGCRPYRSYPHTIRRIFDNKRYPLGDYLLERLLTQDAHADFLCIVELGARVLTRHKIVSLFCYGAGHIA